MGVALMIGRFVLVVLNTVFMIVGCALIIAGVIIRYLADDILKLIKPILAQINSYSTISGYTVEFSTKSEGFDLADILKENAIPFIAVGTILAALAIFGCVGACWGVRILLFIYAIILSILLLGQIIAIGVIAGDYDRYAKKAQDFIKDTAKKEYQGSNATNAFSLLVNTVQMNLKCCGVTNYKDWQVAENWHRKTQKFYPFEIDPKTTGMELPYEIPVACCVMKEPFPSFSPKELDCATTPTKDNSYFEKPCFTYVENIIKEYELYAILVTVGILLVQVNRNHSYIHRQRRHHTRGLLSCTSSDKSYVSTGKEGKSED